MGFGGAGGGGRCGIPWIISIIEDPNEVPNNFKEYINSGESFKAHLIENPMKV